MIRMPISPATYHTIVQAHADKGLGVFSSYSNPDGTNFGGNGERGEMYTLWGFKGADFPLLEAHSTWDIRMKEAYYGQPLWKWRACRQNEVHLYWLLSPEQSDVDEDGKLIWTSLM